MTCKILILALFIVVRADVPTVKVLQGPGSKTAIYGPDGSALSSKAPGGTLVTGSSAPGLVAAGPVILPSSPEVIIGADHTGKIVTSYTLAGPAVVPGVPIVAAAPASSLYDAVPKILGNLGSVNRLYDDGSYKPDKYDDGSYKEGGHQEY